MIRRFGTFDKSQAIFGENLQTELNKGLCSELLMGRCSDCGNTDLKEASSYSRQVRIRTGNETRAVDVTIGRVACSHRGGMRTHAVLAPGIVPYRWYAMGFILEVVAEYLKTGHVRSLCREYEIATSTLYRWLKIARAHMTLLRGIMKGPGDILLAVAETVDHEVLGEMLSNYGQVFTEHLRPAYRKAA